MAEMWMPGAERLPQPGGVTLNKSLPPRATWHITWDKITGGAQPAFENVSGYLQRAGYCPHLMWDPFTGRVVQFYPADVGGRALNAWNEDGSTHVQIEVYFSPGVTHDGVTYQTVADTPCVGWAEILAWIDTLGVPRVWPMSAPQWQGNSRDADIWNTNAGHYGHCNVPQNTHTDPGPMPGLTIQEDDMATLSAITKEAMLNLRGMVVDAVEAATKPILERVTATQRSVAFQEKFNVKMLEKIAATTGTSITPADMEAIRQSVRDELAAGVKVDVTVAGAK